MTHRVDGSRAGNARRSTVTREGCSLLVAREVRTSPESAIEALRDTRTWSEWSPSIGSVESDDRFVREGTRGRVRVAGAWIPFEVTAFSGRQWRWRVAGIPATGHRVEAYADDSERCRVAIEVPIVAAGYVPVCRRALDRFATLVEDE
ncbi:hypothetical protein J2751_000241 [Halorubrum alkaliphilum]|uniref:Polyketide cyclase n=1 Tax=Halorubrum alkaliphilum TaxID=261290 RepID=A0A8T4GA13_9EURY|nr:SRPBCC family protein [Halorubrum alkaliphilum]MBP1921258.1 hypothetical protein [Halorubrum alkaliphilum]